MVQLSSQTKPIWGPLEFKKIGGRKKGGENLSGILQGNRIGWGAGTRNLGEMLLMCLCRKKVQKGEQLVNMPFHVARHSGNPTGSFNGSWISSVGRPHLSPKMCFSLLCPADSNPSHRLPPTTPTGCLSVGPFAHLLVLG